MPETYTGKTKSLLDVTPRDLINRFGELAYIGLIAVEWSRVEALLAHYFALLAFGIREVPDVGESVAIETFELAKSFSEKRSILLRATLKRIDRKTHDDFKPVLQDLQDACNDRNNIMHGRWSMTDEKPYQLVRYERAASGERPMKWEGGDFLKVLDKIRAAGKGLQLFFSARIEEGLKPVPEPWISELTAALQRKDSIES